MALIAVLWIVAALSLMVIGLAGTVRQQIQIIGNQRDQVSGQAAGEAAIFLALQALQVAPQRPAGSSTALRASDGVIAVPSTRVTPRAIQSDCGLRWVRPASETSKPGGSFTS